MLDQPALLSYPDPPLTDGAVLLRRWDKGDIGCVEEASADPRIPEGTTVPATFTPAEGLAWIERQWGRADNGEGLSLAIADAGSGEALGLVVLLFRRQPGTVEIGYWLIPRARGRRLASRAVALVARWALTDAESSASRPLSSPTTSLRGVSWREPASRRRAPPLVPRRQPGTRRCLDLLALPSDPRSRRAAAPSGPVEGRGGTGRFPRTERRRRGRDLNPRRTFQHVRDFQSRSLGHSDTSPSRGQRSAPYPRAMAAGCSWPRSSSSTAKNSTASIIPTKRTTVIGEEQPQPVAGEVRVPARQDERGDEREADEDRGHPAQQDLVLRRTRGEHGRTLLAAQARDPLARPPAQSLRGRGRRDPTSAANPSRRRGSSGRAAARARGAAASGGRARRRARSRGAG